jgi:hypothetical protein
MAVPANLTIETRWDQMFPVLDPSEKELRVTNTIGLARWNARRRRLAKN